MPSTPFAYPQVISRCFTLFRVVNFPQVSWISATSSIPDSSTKKDPGQSGTLWPGSFLVNCRVALDVSALLEV